ncbi:MAG: beta-hydroxyacyl-ACP dehydratase [Planctomycetes bacterium]|nr:beta-hydroxyacyl-ACP dehydratase [Planctomycetota bacterium]MBU4399520.1 beta-hydroxyacyl-ACP dehydratase [Planctomycetota bacterium]MCG2684683.1 beta-hydroxyacyl-ACP dehydratase [Planctomycetales bacterium]
MRWCWIDRFVEFHSDSRAKAVKNVSLAEPYLRGHFPRRPVMPNSLIVEGMGQTGMYLACEAINYSEMILPAKVLSARFHCEAVPGDALTYTVSIDSIQDQGVSVSAFSHNGDRLQGEANLLYARLADRSPDGRGGDLPAMARQMRLPGVFEIGTAADGSRLQPPAMLARSGVKNA